MKNIIIALVLFLIIPFQALADNSNLPVSTTVINYSSSNVTTSAWTEINHSIPAAIRKIEVFDSSGQIMQIGTGTSGNEVALPFTNYPGGIESGVNIYSGQRVVLKAISANATSGYFIINFYL